MSNSENKAPRRLEDLLHIKLMSPRLHPSAIPRVDLLKRLDDGPTRKLTLITAPTGFGKTTLVSMWISRRDRPFAWVTLDENDNDPVRFWTYVCSALRTFDSSLGKTTLAALAGPQLPSSHALLSPLINDLAQLRKNSVLVLDDYHAIASGEIHDGLSFLIQHLPETLHIILLSRSEPPFPVGIMRARGEIIEINVADLRFDESETTAFLHETLSVEIPPMLVSQLQECTEGWVAGLRLAVLSIQDQTAEELEKIIQTFSGSHRYVTDYLIGEVFESQPEVVQDFLLKTCFFIRLNASLCDALTGTSNGVVMLERLERENLFIVQLDHGSAPSWYRYNPLFAESIQYLAKRRLDAEAVQRTGQRAILLSGWAGIGQPHLPKNIFLLKYAPHSWLFPRMAAVVHHGGAGTTAAALRAGVPSVVVPIMSDQPFWGRRVHELQAGTKPIPRSALTVENLAAAIAEATTSHIIQEQVMKLSIKIASEDGASNAVQVIQKILGSA